MLLPVLSGQKSYEEIITHDADWYATHGVTCRFGEKVMAIDRARKVVIGGGLLGLEAAAGMQQRGMDVTVIHLMGHLMERQLDAAAGYLLQKALEKRGIRIHCKAATKAILGGAKLDPMAAVAALPPEGEICGCNGVCKGRIVEAVLAGANTLDLVRARTKASSSCGTCTGLVEQVMAVTLGDGFVANANPLICKCTDHTHEDVRRLIKAMALKSIPAVMQELVWKTPGGCHSCRPALNYYLLSDWPLDDKDDRQSRFVNERKHANI